MDNKYKNRNKINIKLETFRKNPSIVSEALFQILILIISTFAFAVLLTLPIPVVKAASLSIACCEKVKDSNAYCQNSFSDQCDSAFKSAPTSCESTSFCKLGCCYDSVEGTCAENTPRKLCELRNGTFDTNADCKIAQCSMGCCVLGSDASLTTLVKCKKLSTYYGLGTDFRPGITNEDQCIALAQAQDKGACVITTPTETTCKFTSRADCKTITNNQTAFYKDFLCSAEQLATNCARQHHTACIEGKDEVYWFDSCGNAENIYDSDKARSFNNGKILSKEQSCGTGSANAKNTDCGNCDYFTGSMCGKARTGIEPKPTYGESVCRDLNCYKTSNGKDYKHGESWCVYDEPVGEGRDPVGSRQFRHLCVQGEEKVEPCDDFRQGICIEGSYDIQGTKFTEALCRPNRWRDCTSIISQKDCEDKMKRDCYWYLGGESAGNVCLPNVPGGLQFWDAVGQAKTICAAASKQCVAVMEKKPFGDWQCKSNCECLTEEWTQKMNKVCSSLGDCGAKTNFAGKVTSDGYQISSEGKKLKIEGIMGQMGGKIGLGFLGITISVVGSEYIMKMLLNQGLTSNLAPEYRMGFLQGFANVGKVAANTVKWAASGFTKSPNLMQGVISPLTAYQNNLRQYYANEIEKKVLDLQSKGGIWYGGGNGLEQISTAKSEIYVRVGNVPDMSSATSIVQYKYEPILIGKDAAGNPIMGSSRIEEFVKAKGEIAKVESNFMKELKNSKSTRLSNDGVTQVAKEMGIPAQNQGLLTMQNLMNFVNFAMTLYTIYSLVQTIMQFMTKQKQVTVTFTCLPWQAPSGGKDCEKCNGDEMKPCSEYRCKSLGASCSLLNPDSGGKEICANLHPDDTNAPTIKPWTNVLTDGHSYINVKPCPPGPGCWKIVRQDASDGCIKAFTPLEFGISTNEPAQCKIEYNHTAKLDDMNFWFGETNLYLYNRSMKMSLPGPEHINAQSPEIKNDGKYTLYIRCKDGNGNSNTGEMAVQFCVEKGPDNTPPSVERTSIDNGAPVAYGTRNTALDIYLNEPAECKWSRTDQAYENMNSTFSCATGIEQSELDMTYKCSGTLTGISDKTTNKYYMRCKDQPWLAGDKEKDRNVNKESYRFTLEGTQPLNISSVGPNGTIEGGAEPITVKLTAETVNGYNRGEATCYFSPTGYENMIEFFKTDAAEHEQELNLPAGKFDYYILCRDLGGNLDKTTTNFTVEVDNKAPWIIRVYQDAGMLKIITDEESECRYSIKDCNFDFTSATEMPFTLSTEHTAEWRTDITYFIKCMDKFGNMPASSECSMQVNAYDVKASE